MLLTSSTNRVPSARQHDVDAGEIRADSGGRGDRQLRQFGFVMPAKPAQALRLG